MCFRITETVISYPDLSSHYFYNIISIYIYIYFFLKSFNRLMFWWAFHCSKISQVSPKTIFWTQTGALGGMIMFPEYNNTSSENSTTNQIFGNCGNSSPVLKPYIQGMTGTILLPYMVVCLPANLWVMWLISHGTKD